MAIKDEVDFIQNILKQPKTQPGIIDISKEMPGASKTGPMLEGTQPGMNVEEVTSSDVGRTRQAPTMGKPRISQQDIKSIRQESEFGQRMVMGERYQAPSQQVITEDMSLDDAVENMFECINTIDEQIEQFSKRCGRVGGKMLEHWNVLLKRVNKFEAYYDRSIERYNRRKRK